MKIVIHGKGIDCGAEHIIESEFKKDITCPKCILSKAFNKLKRGKQKTYFQKIKERQTKQKKINEHRKQKLKAFIEANPNNPKCELCCYPMVLRVNHKDNSQFWGCYNYPVCKNTKAYNADKNEADT